MSVTQNHYMKLYLSSFLIGSDPGSLANLIGNNKKAAIVMNATDGFGDAKRPDYYRKYAFALGELGLECEELDLRSYFHRPEALRDVVTKFGLLWVTGGNTFVLRRAMNASGLDIFLCEILSKTDLVYGGFSAGACVTCPSLHGIDLADEPETVPPGYSPDVFWDGLGFIDFYIVPHYRSDHPESAAMEAVVSYYEKHQLKFEALSDGEAFVVEHGTITRVGELGSYWNK